MTLKIALPVKQLVEFLQVTIKSCEIRDSRFNVGSFIKYKLEGDEDYTITPTVSKSLSPEFNHSRVVKIEKVSLHFIYLLGVVHKLINFSAILPPTLTSTIDKCLKFFFTIDLDLAGGLP